MRASLVGLALLLAGCPDFDALVCHGAACVEAKDGGSSNDGDGGVATDACTGSGPRCADPTTSEECVDGRWRETSCGSGASCADGICEHWACVPGSTTCANGTTVESCSDDGLSKADDRCPSGEGCASGVCGGATDCDTGELSCDDGCVADVATAPCGEGSCDLPYMLPATGGTFATSMNGDGTDHTSCAGANVSGLVRVFEWVPDGSGSAFLGVSSDFFPMQVSVEAGSCAGTRVDCEASDHLWQDVDVGPFPVTAGRSYLVEIGASSAGNLANPLHFTLTLASP